MKFALLIISIILLVFGCTKDDEIYNRIVILGSSTAAGTGPSHPDSTWVNRFRNYLQGQWKNVEVINLAKGGYVTYQILPDEKIPPISRPEPDPDRNITKALSFKPAAIIINLPSNDASLNYTIQEQLSNYSKILLLTKSKNVPVWVTTTQPRNLSMEGRKNLMAMRDSTFRRFENGIDFWTGLAEEDGNIKPEYNSGDNVHLNDAAHRILFQRVIQSGILKEINQ